MTTQNVDGRLYTMCKVCGNQIDITDKTDTFVVKCAKCGEATVSYLYFYIYWLMRKFLINFSF